MQPHKDSSTALTHKLLINAYGARTAGSEAEAELDTLLDAVMFSLQRVGALEVTGATRESFRDGTIAGWQITAEGHSKNVYKSTILTGG
jgi:hypothetical protein